MVFYAILRCLHCTDNGLLHAHHTTAITQFLATAQSGILISISISAGAQIVIFQSASVISVICASVSLLLWNNPLTEILWSNCINMPKEFPKQNKEIRFPTSTTSFSKRLLFYVLHTNHIYEHPFVNKPKLKYFNWCTEMTPWAQNSAPGFFLFFSFEKAMN